ncbi:MAG: hypothetical protein NTX50_08690 [Candidatus Sumerlaeota bacterium]|nr:hypothetical protein [Candidatus Sumerlaeota bacterium]
MAELQSDALRQPFHLTARPWKASSISKNDYLDAIEGICRFTAKHRDAGGAVIDPFLKREHQYSTPYFAFAVGALLQAGRGKDLQDAGIRAMDHATECFSKGNDGIPDRHGEFFLASLPTALDLYMDHAPKEKTDLWRQRLRIARAQVVQGGKNNWRAYAMKGEWIRAEMGLANRADATAFIEDAYLNAEQRKRIADDKYHLYQDHITDPESHAVEAVGRGNLLGLIAHGYDGPHAKEITEFVERGTAVTLLLQDPSGQCAPNGRTDDHVFNDVLYQLCFEVMAERAQQAGDGELAGQYRRAAGLSFASIARWRRDDGAWAGSYYITKNHFDPAERVGYQPASNYGNYNGAVMMHLAEALLARRSEIAEKPAPVEIGGYAFATDPKFASAVANAGGMQIFAALRGDTAKAMGRYWTALGIERIGRVNWDTRLGPSDGVRDAKTGQGITFAPTWKEGDRWVRMADVPERYRGTFSVQFAHPLLVRCAIDYAPVRGEGPSFRHEITLTPDGALAMLTSADKAAFGVTWPILEDDGRPLKVKVGGGMATTTYSDGGDEQCYLSVGAGETVESEEERLQSTYGWLRPVRVAAAAGANRTFIYPRNAADPPAGRVRESFKLTEQGFDSCLGSVRGSLYIGRVSAGGEGRSIDCNGDGKPDAEFDEPCRFVLQLQEGKITAVESDRKTKVKVGGKTYLLEPYMPLSLNK